MQARNDIGRAEAVQAEIGFLAHELSAALGLGGRSRRVGSPAERARVNVTRALKTALARIAAADPVLGNHLGHCIRTGTFCTYDPNPQACPDWEF